MVEMEVEHGLHLLYTKAWRAKDHVEASVFDAPEESFKLLPTYCHRLKEVNPWTITGKFSSILFVATCLDANNQVFPLAYGFRYVEDELSWTWFLNELKNAIGSPEDCMIISDCHLGIKATIEKVYPNVPHGYYVFHMFQNIKSD
ncbi:hypothetical protein QYF36_019995 [Acer negundo]|nr:hypothetical protein QYF36_019995 [Acer negundo]